MGQGRGWGGGVGVMSSLMFGFKCSEYHAVANVYQPLDAATFCFGMGTCQDGEEIDISSFATDVFASADRYLHQIHHVGLRLENQEMSISDEDVTVASTTRHHDEYWTDLLVRWWRGDAATDSRTPPPPPPLAQDQQEESAMKVFCQYQDQLEKVLLLERMPEPVVGQAAADGEQGRITRSP